MEELSRDLRSVVARFVPLPSIAKLLRTSKLLRLQWQELFQRRVAACARKSIDATCDMAGLVLLFLDDTGGVFHFRVGSNAGWTSGLNWTLGHNWSVMEEIRGRFSLNCGGDEFYLTCEEQTTGLREVTEWRLCSAEAVATVSRSTIEVAGMPLVGSKSLVIVSHGPFSFSFIAFFRTQLDLHLKRGASELGRLARTYELNLSKEC